MTEEKKKELTWKEKYLLLKALNSSHVEATKNLEIKYHALVDKSNKQQALLENAQKAVENYKEIMVNSVTKHNEDLQHVNDRVIELKHSRMQAPR